MIKQFLTMFLLVGLLFSQSGPTNLNYSYGSHVIDGGTGVYALEETLGFDPKVVFLWCGATANQENGEVGFGYFDADGNTACLGISIEDNSGSQDTRNSIWGDQNTSQGGSAGKVMHFDYDGATNAQISAQFQKCDSDSVAIYYTTADAAFTMSWLILGGTAIDAYEVVEGNMPASNAGGTEELDFGTTGFGLKMTFFLSGGSGSEGAQEVGLFGFGVIDDDGDEDGIMFDPMYSTGSNNGYSEYGDATNIPVTRDDDITVDSITDSSCVLDYNSGPEDAEYFVAIGVGGDFNTDLIQMTQAGADNTWHETNPAFEPEAMISFGTAVSHANEVGNIAQCNMATGFFAGIDSTYFQSSMYVYQFFGGDPSRVQSQISTAHTIYGTQWNPGPDYSTEKYSHVDSGPGVYFETEDNVTGNQFSGLIIQGASAPPVGGIPVGRRVIVVQ